jgi:hypothetical protein
MVKLLARVRGLTELQQKIVVFGVLASAVAMIVVVSQMFG